MSVPNSDFREFCYREAFAVENKIVYFGSSSEGVTFVLEKDENSEQLNVIRKEPGFDLSKRFANVHPV